MRTCLRLAMTVAMAVAALMLIGGTAVANRNIAVERGGEVRISEGRLTFEESGRVFRVTCNTTLVGKLTRTGVQKVARALPGGVVGIINEGRFSGCTEGAGGEAQVRLLAEPEQPIQMTYEAFLGTLPSITGILALALAVRLQIIAASMTCEYAGDLGVLVTFPAVEEANTARFLESSRFRLTGGGLLCPREGFAKGTFKMTPAQRIILNGFTPSVGTLRAEENPVVIGSGVSEKTIILTNNGREALSVREVFIRQNLGRIEVIPERRCTILLPQERCNVRLSVNERRSEREPAGEGVIRFEYSNGGGRTELEVPYTIQR
jgi:hypothetical protein